jgi:hypothetical protein
MNCSYEHPFRCALPYRSYDSNVQLDADSQFLTASEVAGLVSRLGAVCAGLLRCLESITHESPGRTIPSVAGTKKTGSRSYLYTSVGCLLRSRSKTVPALSVTVSAAMSRPPRRRRSLLQDHLEQINGPGGEKSHLVSSYLLKS